MGSCLTKSKSNDYYTVATVITEDSDITDSCINAHRWDSDERRQLDCKDEYTKFLAHGGSITRLIEMYRAPTGWDEELKRRYPVGFFCEKQNNGQKLHSCTIHLNDDLDTTKRHFLSFYDLKVHEMDPEDFMQWCFDNHMPNTCADYLSLYSVSKFQGENSKVLRNLSRSRYVVNIHISDRFLTHNGRYRALVFQANTKQGLYWVFSAFMSRLDPESYRYVRCAVEPYGVRKKEKRIAEQNHKC